MPTIKSSADLRNNYNEISTFCHNYPEPVFIQCHLVKPVSTNFAAVPNFKNRYPYVTQNLKNITFPIIPDS